MSYALQYALFTAYLSIVVYMVVFIVGKVITQDWKWNRKETIFLLIAVLLATLSRSVEIYLTTIFAGAYFSLLSSSALILLFLLYFYKIKYYSFRKSFILMFIVLLFATVLESAVALVFTSVFPNLYFGLSVVPPIHAQHFLHYIPYALLYSTVSLVSTVLLVKVTQSLRTFINQNTQAQTVLLWISVISTIIILLAANAWIMQGDILIFSWNTFFLFTYVGASILVFIFFTRELKIKATIQQKETEQQAMSFYLHQLEEHLSGMRKFKHDYLNILNALYGFILAGDWDGLANYYTTKIEPASAIIVTDEFALENLSNIQAPEIKGILALKLMIAQNISMDIHTSVEAHEEIGAIPVDSISLVRMLGIIMDNAIEELETLGKGDLVIACFKTGNTVTFIVQNTCRPAISLRDLSQTGFTNKGEGHGLGLSNLSELAAAHPNITLQTSIADGTFTQRLIIGGE